LSEVVAAADEPQPDVGYSFGGGDGSTVSDAIVVHAKTEGVGIRAEYAWVRDHWPGAHRNKQALVMNGGRSYDALTTTDASGQVHTLYFEITEFFGK
jgi:hypothetical protein